MRDAPLFIGSACGGADRLHRSINCVIEGDLVAEERLLWEDLNPGDTSESLNRTVTEADVVNFCGVSGDFNWFHIDDVKAKESVFGQRVAHGMLVTSIATGLRFGSRVSITASISAASAVSRPLSNINRGSRA